MTRWRRLRRRRLRRALLRALVAVGLLRRQRGRVRRRGPDGAP